jgi:hypothetical protein
MNQSDTWQYSTRVNSRVTSADGHISEFRESRHGVTKTLQQEM